MTHERNSSGLLLPGVLVAAGLALGGYFIGNGLFEARASQRYVTVKGLSEREVAADLAIWPIVFTVTGNDLETLQRRIDDTANKVAGFLSADFDGDEYALSLPRITDYSLQSYPADSRPPSRYAAELTMSLRSSKVDRVKAAMNRAGELVKSGVPIVHSYEYQTEFLFTSLDTIKPEMIAEATGDARRAAQQFANDSGSKVGAIRSAQQGYFSISDRDRFSPEFKQVRVVTTVQYFLVDD
jgi:hypothetical protein